MASGVGATALLLLLALLGGAPRRLAAAAGDPCSCSTETMRCADRNKSSLRPDELCAAEEVVKWELSRNRLTRLSFVPTPCHIETLDVANNLISSLDGSSLKTCANLFMLMLSGNPLPALPDNSLLGLSNLAYLELDRTGLKSLDEKSFSGLSSLFSLNLRGNKLTTLPKNVFNDLVRMSFLDISSNHLTHIPDGIFSNLIELRFLNLSCNKISRLQAGLFANARQLMGLNVSRNRLTHVDDGVLDGLTHMRRFDVHENALTQLPLLRDCCIDMSLADFTRNNVSAPRVEAIDALLRVSTRLRTDLRANPLSHAALCDILRAADAPACARDASACLCGALHFCRGEHMCMPSVRLCEQDCTTASDKWTWSNAE